MTHVTGRRALLQSAAAAFGGAMLPRIAGTTSSQAQTAKPYEFLVKDLVYSHSGGKDRLARLYQPAGMGPFPAVVQVHGGSWAGNDRTDGQNISLDLVEAGIVVLAIEFRNSPEAPYPAALQDINYGIRWLKAHAPEFGSSAQIVAIGRVVTRDGKFHGNGDKEWLHDFDGWDLPAWCYVDWNRPSEPIQTTGLTRNTIQGVNQPHLLALAEELLNSSPPMTTYEAEPPHTKEVEDETLISELVHSVCVLVLPRS
jgi:hypothetical protein